MSVIGSGIVSSVLAGEGAQRHRAKVDDAARNEQADASRQLAGGDVILEVEGADKESQVNADSEGTGGSGRDGRWGDPDQPETAPNPTDSDTPPDHIDLTA